MLSVNSMNLKGFVLAAGFGSRLMPLTKYCPKPLLSFMGRPLIFYLLDQFGEHGIQEVGVNAHHLSQQIDLELKKHYLADNIHLLVEEGKILGTGGAFQSFEKWREKSDLLVMNGDIFHTFQLEKIIKQHYSQNTAATLVLKDVPHPGETPVWVKEGKVVAIQKDFVDGAQPCGFTCIHLISNNSLSQLVKDKTECIIEHYKNEINRQKDIGAYIEKNILWYDIGSPKKFWQAHYEVLNSLVVNNSPTNINMKSIKENNRIKYYDNHNKVSPLLIAKDSAVVNDKASLKGFSFISQKTHIPEGVEIESSIILPGTKLERNEKIKNLIVTPQTRTLII